MHIVACPEKLAIARLGSRFRSLDLQHDFLHLKIYQRRYLISTDILFYQHLPHIFIALPRIFMAILSR
jgi:hypothetical protein